MKSYFSLLTVVGVLVASPYFSSAAVAATPVQLRECSYAGQAVTADLSTTTNAGADPHWTVSGPGAGGPTHTTLSAWTALPSNWIQPTSAASNTADSGLAAGDYTYSVQFVIPCDPRNYQSIAVAGTIAADNRLMSLSINGNAVAGVACSSINTCFNTPPGGTPFTIPAGQLRPGVNTMTVVVRNDGSYTGVAVRATLRAVCGKECCRPLPPKPPGR